MFESAELGHAVSKASYTRTVPKQRGALLDAQYSLSENGRFPVIILLAA